MRLKSFHARDTAQAIAQVRQHLGPDAIIVTSRQVPGGVHITAAVDEFAAPPEPPPSMAGPAPAEDIFAAQPTDRMDLRDLESPQAPTQRLAEALARHGLGDPARGHILSAASRAEGDPLQRAIAGLRHVYLFHPIGEAQPLAQPIALVGPSGAGKTLAVAKLAARAVLQGLRPAVISTDCVRAGGMEQLASFARLLGIEMLAAEDALSLADAIHSVQGADQILIDTAGTNPFSEGELAELQEVIGGTGVEPVLALSAGGDPAEAEDIAAAFLPLGVRRMVATRLDTTRRYGSILLAAVGNGLALANVANSAKVADGLPGLTAGVLARLLLALPKRQVTAPAAAHRAPEAPAARPHPHPHPADPYRQDSQDSARRMAAAALSREPQPAPARQTLNTSPQGRPAMAPPPWERQAARSRLFDDIPDFDRAAERYDQ